MRLPGRRSRPRVTECIGAGGIVAPIVHTVSGAVSRHRGSSDIQWRIGVDEGRIGSRVDDGTKLLLDPNANPVDRPARACAYHSCGRTDLNVVVGGRVG